MSAYIFDGKRHAKDKEELLKSKILELNSKNIYPRLDAILVGTDPASVLYVNLKKKAAERIGIFFNLIHLDKAEEVVLLQLIKSLNNESQVHGVMIQLPLPGKLDEKEATQRILYSIDPAKDVDGLTSSSLYVPATVRGVLSVIECAQDLKLLSKDLSKVQVCVVGYTGAVGSALVRELSNQGIDVIGCNSKTLNLRVETLKADLLISVTGVPGNIKKDMVKSGAVVVDVGSPKGDVEESVREIASFVTPVPGGIGPMTVISLMENLVEAAEKSSLPGLTLRG